MTKTTRPLGPWSPLPAPGTRVVLTGALGGLGRAVSAALDELDCPWVGFDLPAAVDATVDDPRYVGVDITDTASIDAGVAHGLSLLGGVDALIGAAGIVDAVHRAATFPDDAFRSDVEANLVGPFLVARALHPHLRASTTGAIAFVASQAGVDGLPGQAAYAASKAGLIGLTTTLAGEWVGDGIRVNAVAPGLFATPKVVAMPEAVRARMVGTVPMGRVGEVGEVVGPLLFLLSPAAGYMTGRTLRLDGGAGLGSTGFYR